MTTPPVQGPKSSARLLMRMGRRAVPLALLPFAWGRRSGRSLHLPDPQVSRGHALIDHDQDGCYLRDMGSGHGTVVSGLRVESGSALPIEHVA